MYFENSNTKRASWVYHYKGKNLLKPTIVLLEITKKENEEQRKKMSSFMLDSSIDANSKQVSEVKEKIQTTSRLLEELSVYKHEFEKDPEREYALSLGDVVFFNYPEIR